MTASKSYVNKNQFTTFLFIYWPQDVTPDHDRDLEAEAAEEARGLQSHIASANNQAPTRGPRQARRTDTSIDT